MSFTMDDFDGYTYAMEVVNGEIISMSGNFQHKIRTALKKKLHISDKTLKEYLADGGSEDPRFKSIEDYDCDFLSEVTGYDPGEDEFTDEGIGFLDSRNGWEANDLLKFLGFKLSEKIDEGPHGHGTIGVIYYGSRARS